MTERIVSKSEKEVVTSDIVNGQEVTRSYSVKEWAAKERGDIVSGDKSKMGRALATEAENDTPGEDKSKAGKARKGPDAAD